MEKRKYLRIHNNTDVEQYIKIPRVAIITGYGRQEYPLWELDTVKRLEHGHKTESSKDIWHGSSNYHAIQIILPSSGDPVELE
jgi:hypothetical protein